MNLRSASQWCGELPLQLNLNALAELIAQLCSAAGLILYTALMIRFFIQLGEGEPARWEIYSYLVRYWGANKYYYLQECKPEGYRIHSDTYHLCYFDHRGCPWRSSFGGHSRSCFHHETHDLWETSHTGFRILPNYANASVVCTNKTGILTQNDMLVVAGSVSIHGKFVQKLKDHQAQTNAGEEVAEDSLEPAGSRKHPHNFSIDQADFIASSLMLPLLLTWPLSKMPILRPARSSSSVISQRLLCPSLWRI